MAQNNEYIGRNRGFVFKKIIKLLFIKSIIRLQ